MIAEASPAISREQLTELPAAATRSGVRIFAIAVAFDEPGIDPSDPVAQAHRVARRNSLEAISEATGGFAMVDGNLATGLKHIAIAMRN